jgi:hypothetical protein
MDDRSEASTQRDKPYFGLADHVIHARFPTFLPTFFQPHFSLVSNPGTMSGDRTDEKHSPANPEWLNVYL